MKKFFGGVFLDKESLKEAGINHPIKLDYYKRINEEYNTEIKNEKYGLSIVKTEYINKKIKVEEKVIKHLTNDEKKLDFILQTLKKSRVTPFGLDDIIFEFAKQIL